MIEEFKIPGQELLDKYKYKIDSNDGLILKITTDKNVSLFDRQKLFAFGWKQYKTSVNSFSIDLMLCD